MTEPGTMTAGASHEVASLVRMANQIASNAAFQPHDVAVAQVAAHLRDFWHPSMRAALVAFVDAGGTGLDPLPTEALELLRRVPGGGPPEPES